MPQKQLMFINLHNEEDTAKGKNKDNLGGTEGMISKFWCDEREWILTVGEKPVR